MSLVWCIIYGLGCAVAGAAAWEFAISPAILKYVATRNEVVRMRMQSLDRIRERLARAAEVASDATSATAAAKEAAVAENKKILKELGDLGESLGNLAAAAEAPPGTEKPEDYEETLVQVDGKMIFMLLETMRKQSPNGHVAFVAFILAAGALARVVGGMPKKDFLQSAGEAYDNAPVEMLSSHRRFDA
jgi:hypothetical protein